MMRTKLSLVLLLLFVLAFVALATSDPELKQCKHQCRVQQQYDERQKKECVQQCESYHQENQRREHETGGGSEGGRSRDVELSLDNPREEQRREQDKRGGGKDINEYGRESEREEEEKEEYGEEEGRNPYVFEDQHFSTIFRTEHGRTRVLPKFSERSKLLKGIDNYRILILEANPQTFVLPKHCDADTVFFVAQGRGSVSMVRQQKRESFNIRRGDVVVVPSGTTEYVINRSKNEKLVVAMLIRPVNTPGRFETFFGAGGEEPESFYRTFSEEILEAAFNIRRDRFQRILGQQRQGGIVKASEEQIRGMSHHEEGGTWPFGGEHKGSVNIFDRRPSQSNQYGQLFEVDGSEFRQLQDLDVAVSVANITEGSMSTLLYNSRATKIAIVANGEGYLEMACPHLSQLHEGRRGSQQGHRGVSEREERRDTPSYQKVSARLRRGVVVVIPAGHPHVAVASENQNLEMVSFEVNAKNNERFSLAGRSNVINQLERHAKELAFGVPAREVEEVFRSQEEDFFFRGPSRRQSGGEHEGRADV